MECPLISIVTVCFNSEKEIENTIHSVINQTYPNIEYIIIDGGSTDSTVEIIKKYINRISLFISEPDKGIYDAMNKGVENATGDWINFMNSGDEFVNNEVLFNVFVNKEYPTDIAVVYGNTILKTPFGYYHYNCMPKDGEMPITHQSAFTRSSLMKKYKFDLTYKIIADANLFRILRLNNYTLKHIEQTISIYEAIDGYSAKHNVQLLKEQTKMLQQDKGFVYFLTYLRALLGEWKCKYFSNSYLMKSAKIKMKMNKRITPCNF